MLANNCIANRIEKSLKATALPENTAIIDSMSVAGKLVGNGNGMQYMGAILITSDLTADELRNFYSQSFDHIQVTAQHSATVTCIEIGRYHFDRFDDSVDNCYAITCWDAEDVPDWARTLLDLDLRGH